MGHGDSVSSRHFAVVLAETGLWQECLLGEWDALVPGTWRSAHCVRSKAGLGETLMSQIIWELFDFLDRQMG